MNQTDSGYLLGDRIEGTIERIVPGGLGLLRGPRGVVFVERSAPGDRLQVEIDEMRSGVARGSIVRILEPGPARIEAPCPWYGRCGGCDFQHLEYRAQVEAKRQMLLDALVRIGGFDLLPEVEIFAASHPFGSRARIELHTDQEQRTIGFFERRSSSIVPVDRCLVSRPELNSAVDVLRRSTRPYPASISLASGNGVVRSAPAFPPIDGGAFWLRIAEHEYLVDPGSFFQSSLDLLPALIGRVVGTDEPGGEVAWDLFCGAGLFSFPLAARFHKVVGVDSDARTIRSAVKGAERNGIGNTVFIAADSLDWISGRKQRDFRPDLIVVDPPRSGLGARLADRLSNVEVRRLIYVSCDPATLARDLKRLAKSSYRVVDIAIFDLFPQTHHVETVVRLEHR
ncbi:MAG: class I SAM-dependent RNA methyltransferase [Thermomicrobiales bacterium]